MDTGKKNPLEFRITTVKPYNKEILPSSEPPFNRLSFITQNKEEISSRLSQQLLQTSQVVVRISSLQNTEISPSFVKWGRGRPRKQLQTEKSLNEALIAITIAVQPNFTLSHQKEINDLLNSGVFSIVTSSEILSESRIFESRFVDKIKHKETEKIFKKSRLVV